MFDVFSRPRNPESPGGLGNRAGVIENILDGGANFIRADGHHFIHKLVGNVEGLLANLLDGHAVGEQADLTEDHPATGFHGPVKAVGIIGFYPDDPDVGPDKFDVGSDTGNQSTAPHRDEDGMNGVVALPEYLHADGTLSGNDLRIIIRMDKPHLLFG